jgi:hypothetical protein
MATSTLVQFLGDGITSPTSIEGDTSNRRQVETFIAGGAIAAGDVVAFDTSKTGADRVLYVTEAAQVANGNGLSCGVALAAATAGEQVRAVIGGYALVSTHGGVALGNLLTAGGTSAGTVDGRIASDISPAFGITLEARVGAGLVAAWIYKSF